MKMILKDGTEFEVDSMDYANRESAMDSTGREIIMVSTECKSSSIKDLLQDLKNSLTKENISGVTFQTNPLDGAEGFEVEYSFSSVDSINMHMRDHSSSIDVRFVI